MDNRYIWLIIGEIIVILFVIFIKIIFHMLEKKKIDSILNIMKEYKKDRETKKKLKECIEIIKQNNKEE